MECSPVKTRDMFIFKSLKMTLRAYSKLKKHLFKKICKSSIRTAGVYGMWPWTHALSPWPHPTSVREKLYCRRLQPKNTGLPCPSAPVRELSPQEGQDDHFSSWPQLPVAKAKFLRVQPVGGGSLLPPVERKLDLGSRTVENAWAPTAPGSAHGA